MKTTIEAMLEEMNHSPRYMLGFIDACGALNQITEEERLALRAVVTGDYEDDYEQAMSEIGHP